ncbi:CRTAC1 family protein [Lutibacter citreus]|uniref:CRTAC1 family protein n=1 Tax=Lutibacter citreus TaxID=2138210 RepID=UPI000DBE2B12|nr:CRTAC1 family protein [Lutibacter citreus]
MKKIFITFLFILISTTFFSCKKTQKDPKQVKLDLMSAQTLGLAYLEEFNLELAKNEFLKVIELAPNKKRGYANLGLTYLRMGNNIEAEKQLLKAIKIDPKDADVRLMLATVYQMKNNNEKAKQELKKALEFDHSHVKILYNLSELYSLNNDESSRKERKLYILKLVKNAPGNIVPKLDLTTIFIQDGETDAAINQLEIIQKQFPEFPKEAVEFYDNTLQFLKKKDKENALVQFTIFQNYLKVTFPYQSGIKDLKGPGGSSIGFPLITYNHAPYQVVENESILDVIKFVKITAPIGLEIVPVFKDESKNETLNSTQVETADYDGDGDFDLYVSSFDASTSTYKHFLFNNDMVQFNDVSEQVGINHTGEDTFAKFVDYDNDGFLDLYIVRKNGDILYRNEGKGAFKNVTDKAGIDTKGGNKALFFDYDHDGDLDLFKTTSSFNIVYRNNGDGTFKNISNTINFSGKANSNSVDAAFGDFDDDGDIDLLVINSNESASLFSNQREGRFKNLTDKSGIKDNLNSSNVSVGDYNNDGFLDLFITSLKDGGTLFENKGEGKFEKVKKSGKMENSLKGVKAYDSKFFDFDNDGFLDIIVAGESEITGKRGLQLFHNDGKNEFSNVSHLLPEDTKSAKQLTLLDYNNDGDLDLIITGLDGGVFLLRNDGGSINHYVNVKLVGLRNGSAKNNYFGIGAKVEIRAGDLYQTMVVTDPNVYFGLGHRAKVDIIRITWTNGVPQNMLLPDADQALIESQVLKGSCPFLYTWNGSEYVFVKDITWRSALGMPLGIMGGTTLHAFPDASDDYIKIPGEMLQPKDEMYSLKITSELWETIYMDKVQLVAVDHPDSIDVFIPEQFTPPPFPGLDITQVYKKHTPVSAKNLYGNDVLSFITEKDDKYLSDFKLEKYQGLTEMQEIILDPGNLDFNKEVFIFLNGWIFPSDASINVALSQTDKLKVSFPVIQVVNKKGNWETVDKNLGFPMGKDKTVIADLSGKFLSNDHRIKIKTNMEIYWNQIFFSNSNPNVPMEITELNPDNAEIHYRGFSHSYKKGGRYGPHWFDYYDVDKTKKWRDLTGNYTRYGDVLPLLKESDNKYIISNAGDETSLNFSVSNFPKLKVGWKRDFLIHSVGWVKDGDINTSFGQTVLPLPFHGMESYPPSKNDIYPNNSNLKEYNQEYNTRIVKMDDYRNLIKKNKQE